MVPLSLHAIKAPCKLHGRSPEGVNSLSCPYLQATITEFATLDKQRISYLRGVLGSAAVARPQINIGDAFEDAFSMANGGTTVLGVFSPYADDQSFLEGACSFGDLQVNKSSLDATEYD